MDSGLTHCCCGTTPCICRASHDLLPSLSHVGHCAQGHALAAAPLTFENVFHATYTSGNLSRFSQLPPITLNDVTSEVVNDLEPVTRKRKKHTKSGARKRQKDGTSVSFNSNEPHCDLPAVVGPAVFGVGPVSASSAPTRVPAHGSLLHGGPADTQRAVVASDVWFSMVPVSAATQPEILPDTDSFKPSRIRPRGSHLACSFCL
jgi:hypothetical protein